MFGLVPPNAGEGMFGLVPPNAGEGEFATGQSVTRHVVTRHFACLASLRKRNELRQPRQREIEQHADKTDREDAADDVCDRQVVPLVPDEITDASAAYEHLCGHD